MNDRFYIFGRDGTILGGPYSTHEEADAIAEREHRAYSRFAFVGTMDAWNQWNSRWSVVG